MALNNSISWKNAGLEAATILFDIRIQAYVPTGGHPEKDKVHERRITAFKTPDLLFIQNMDPKQDALQIVEPLWYLTLFETKIAGADWPRNEPYFEEEKKLVDMVAKAYGLK